MAASVQIIIYDYNLEASRISELLFYYLDIRCNLPRLQKVKLVWTGHEAKYDFYGKPRVAYAFYVVKSLMSPCLIFV